jgi:hypothetical protein
MRSTSWSNEAETARVRVLRREVPDVVERPALSRVLDLVLDRQRLRWPPRPPYDYSVHNRRQRG